MTIRERTVGDVTVLDLEGRLVFVEGDELLRDAVDRLVHGGRRKVLLNLDGVTYLDSAGVGVIVGKYVTLQRAHGQLKLCNLRPRAREVLSIARLMTVLESFESVADGVQSFGDPAPAR